ncbi:unnamed protein product [Prunus brigantina]
MMRLFELRLLTKRLWPREELVLKVRYKKNKLLRGRLGLVLDPLHLVLSLVFIGRVLESDWGKQVVQSTFGIVKHGGVTPINLGKSQPPP